MGRPDEVALLIRKGYPPSQIAMVLKSSGSGQPLTISTVKGYMWRAVGEGLIRLSDIVFAIPQDTREKIDRLVPKYGGLVDLILAPPRIVEEMRKANLNSVDTEIYLNLRRAVYGDLYGLLYEIEVHLHAILKNALIANYGVADWWKKGVDRKIKEKCEGYARADRIVGLDDALYHYTSLHDLITIMKNLSISSSVLSGVAVSDRDKFVSDLARLVKLRNAIMHPVKGLVPTKEDYIFAQEVYSALLGTAPPI